MRVSRSYTFDAAHQLPFHKGKCANLHGHTYTVVVTVDGPISTEPSSEGMVIDFENLDAYVKPVITMMDHKFLVGGEEPVYDAMLRNMSAEDVEATTFVVGHRTTSENLAMYLLGKIRPRITAQLEASYVSVSVSETPRSAALAEWWG